MDRTTGITRPRGSVTVGDVVYVPLASVPVTPGPLDVRRAAKEREWMDWVFIAVRQGDDEAVERCLLGMSEALAEYDAARAAERDLLGVPA